MITYHIVFIRTQRFPIILTWKKLVLIYTQNVLYWRTAGFVSNLKRRIQDINRYTTDSTFGRCKLNRTCKSWKRITILQENITSENIPVLSSLKRTPITFLSVYLFVILSYFSVKYFQKYNLYLHLYRVFRILNTNISSNVHISNSQYDLCLSL